MSTLTPPVPLTPSPPLSPSPSLSSPTLSIIIVNWNTRELLAQCLESVSGNVETWKRGNVETFVVDNASTDGSSDMVRERFPWVRLIQNAENVGFACANNQAIKAAKGRYVVLLNSDTEIYPEALQSLMAVLQSHPEAGAVGPCMLNPDGSLQNSYGRLPTVLDEFLGPYWADFINKPWGILGRRFHNRQQKVGNLLAVDRVSFACTMTHRAVLEQVGVLDESFEFYSEDYDWFKRLKDTGWMVLFCPQAKVMHHWGASSRRRSEWALRQLYRSKRLYFRKHHGAGSEGLLRLGMGLRFIAKMGLIVLSYPFRPADAKRELHSNVQLLKDMWSAL